MPPAQADCPAAQKADHCAIRGYRQRSAQNKVQMGMSLFLGDTSCPNIACCKNMFYSALKCTLQQITLIKRHSPCSFISCLDEYQNILGARPVLR